MSQSMDGKDFDHAELVSLYALQALPAAEMAQAQAHIAQCPECRRELEAMRPVMESMVAWPVDVLRPEAALWDRLAERVGVDPATEALESDGRRWVEPEWKEVAPGITVKMLATDAATNQISMLVHLEPGTDYPPHAHAGTEELHLLDGELWIDDRLLHPGDYNRAEAGTADKRVWSETGCTCVLITSTRDVLS